MPYAEDSAHEFYRVERAPAAVLSEFDRAARTVDREARARGETWVSKNAAFVALLQSIDLAAAVAEGMAAAATRPQREQRKPRGFHLPADLKAEVVALARRCGINVGTVGQLVLLSRAGRLEQELRDAVAAERSRNGNAGAN